MMTGQVLGGSSPQKAARYQIVIYFLISGTVTTAVGLICTLTVRSLFDKEGRMATKRITKQSRKKVAELLNPSAYWRCCSTLLSCCRRSSRNSPLLSAVSDAHQPRVVKLNCQATRRQGPGCNTEAILEINLQGASLGSVSLW